MLEPRMAAILGQLEDLAQYLDRTDDDGAPRLRAIIADRFDCGVEVAWTDPTHGHVRGYSDGFADAYTAAASRLRATLRAIS
jgi:hypothetical protein